MTELSILDKLEAFEIGDTEVSFTFSQRLARDNDWTEKFANRVITEYKRFIYLASISDTAVTPSDSVDQAWHLHLSYTQSYWNELCGDLLKVEIHHNPTLGGSSQQQLFELQYTSTLDLYESIFNEKPPNDIWPNVRSRFENVDGFIRVDRSKNWLIPKPTLNIRNLSVCALLPVLIAACGASLDDKESRLWLIIGICGVLLLVVVLLVVAFVKIYRGKSGDKGGSGGNGGCAGCSGCGGCGA